MARILPLVIALLVLVSGCILPAATDDEMEFTFPDVTRDTYDPVTEVWRGTRNYTGKRGAKISYPYNPKAPACAGLIHTVQSGDYYPGTRIDVQGTGLLKLDVQGPCSGSYQVTVIPAP